MNRAGQETLIMNLFRRVHNRVLFDFLCTIQKVGDYDSEIFSLGGKIFYLSAYCERKWIVYISIFFSYYEFFCTHKEYDIVHIHNYHAFTSFIEVLAAKMAGVKHVILHSHNSDAPHRKLHFFFRRILNMFNISRLACSQSAAYWMYGTCKSVILVNNGIELNKFMYSGCDRSRVRESIGIKDEFVVGHIGRFNYQKNHLFLLNIFNEILKRKPDSILLLVGEGELEENIRKKINELSIVDHVKFLGVRTDIAALLSSFDLLLFPSLFEGLSVVLIEAQASDLSILASDTISDEALMTDKFCMLSLKKSPASIWADKALEKSVSYPRERKAISILQDKGYDICDVAEKITSFYLNLK